MSSKVFNCGCSLKAKTLFIGFFSLFVQFIVSVIILHPENGENEWSLGVHEIPWLALKLRWQVTVTTIVFIIILCLIYGAIEERKWFLVPYISSFGAVILVFAAYAVHSILSVSLIPQTKIYSDVIFPALLLLHILIIMVYSWMTVYSYFVELEEMEFDRDGYGLPFIVNAVDSSKDISFKKAIKF